MPAGRIRTAGDRPAHAGRRCAALAGPPRPGRARAGTRARHCLRQAACARPVLPINRDLVARKEEHMNPFTLDDLKTLTLQKDGPCVSICLPTHRSAAEMRTDQIRFKNLLRAAEERLLADGLRAPEARALLEPAHKLEADSQFWRRAGDGMAVYASGGFFRAYHVPLALEELVVVAHRFDVKPLLPLVRDDSRFYILALSQNAVRLLLGTHYSVAEITPEALPRGLADAMKFDEAQRDLQYHTVSSPGAGGPQAVFHGHSEGRDGEKERIGRYFQQVDRGLHRMLHAENVPLMLAGVEYLVPLYRQANTYPHLLADAVIGNPDDRTAADLHSAAWALL